MNEACSHFKAMRRRIALQSFAKGERALRILREPRLKCNPSAPVPRCQDGSFHPNAEKIASGSIAR